jgi:hypothetical protein
MDVEIDLNGLAAVPIEDLAVLVASLRNGQLTCDVVSDEDEHLMGVNTEFLLVWIEREIKRRIS